MDKYNGKTVRLKGSKRNILFNTIVTRKDIKYTIEKDFEPIDSNYLYITNVDKELNIYKNCFSEINDKILKINIKNILKLFNMFSTKFTKKYVRSYDTTKYVFFVPVINMIDCQTNNRICDCDNNDIFATYIININGPNKYMHDTSKKFPICVLNTSPRCVSPDWYLWENEYIDYPNDNFYNSKKNKKNKKNNKIQQINMLEQYDISIQSPENLNDTNNNDNDVADLTLTK